MGKYVLKDYEMFLDVGGKKIKIIEKEENLGCTTIYSIWQDGKNIIERCQKEIYKEPIELEIAGYKIEIRSRNWQMLPFFPFLKITIDGKPTRVVFHLSQNKQMLEIKINSDEDIMKLGDYLHDAYCEKNNIKYDAGKETLDIIFTERSGLEYTRKWFLNIFQFFCFPLRESPAVKSHLHLEGVQQCFIETKDEKWERDEFDECEIRDTEYHLIFHCCVRIRLLLKKPLVGCLKDLELM